ncbi:MAG: CHASE2 domain-containing protein [Gemmatimonadota bacterium]
MPGRILRAVFSREFGWYLLSWKFLVWFLAIKALMVLFERHPVLQRANLGGFDAAMTSSRLREASRTVVVAITEDDVARYFANTRPVPPESLLRVVGEIAKLEPAVLVVDVFTDGPEYRNRRLPVSQTSIVWARSADTLRGAVLPALGGRTDVPVRSGFAAMLAEEDGLVRRVRLRFSAGPTSRDIESLPLAAVMACPAARHPWCRLSPRIPQDTNSIALRTYSRVPPFFALEDVMAAAAAGMTDSPLAGKVAVLGFADGSDRLATPQGIRAGPEVVADAVEGLVDARGPIRRMPGRLSFLIDLAAAILVMAVQFSLRHRPQMAALFTLAAILVAWFLSRLVLIWPGYWTSVVPVMMGIWLEQLLEEIKGKPNPKGPPAWTQWLLAKSRPASHHRGVEEKV